MKNIFLLLATLCVLCSTPSAGQEKTVTYYADPSSLPPDLAMKLTHVEARVSFVPSDNLVRGVATLTMTALRYHTDTIVLYTPDFTVSDVTVDGKTATWQRVGANLVIRPPQELAKNTQYKVSVRYESRPLSGAIYFIGWRPEEQGKRKQIWAHRPHGWIPYMDGRVTMDIYITFDKQFTAFANGERKEVKENPDGTKTWHYAMTMNHPFFSTALAIGDYDFKTSFTNRGIPLELLYYRGMEDRVKPTYQYTEQMFSFYEQEMGLPYPYPVYREIPVIDYMYGGMECTTSTIFGDYMLIDPRAYWQRNYINVNAHELAHQWFGDYISHYVNRDVWLTESFGTYYAKIFERSIFGEEYYENEMNNELLQTFAAAKNNNYPVGGSQGGTARIYQKGSLVLGMLRDIMGDREFKDAIRSYLEQYGLKSAQTGDFIRIVYETSGKPYDWFFDEWIFRGGEPHYKISWSQGMDSTGRGFTLVNVDQVQKKDELSGLFRMPVDIEVHYKDGSKDSLRVWIEKEHHTVLFPDPGKREVAFILFDPGRKVLKQVTFDRTTKELGAQALQAEHMIDRYDALVALKPVNLEEKRDILLGVYPKEHFHLTKSEVLRQLAGGTDSATLAVFHSALTDRDANVRKTAMLCLPVIPPALQNDVEEALADSSYLNVEIALDILCRNFPSEATRYLDLTKNEKGWRGLNIRMKWLEIAVSMGDRQYLPELVAYSGPGYEFETRMNSLSVLQKLGYCDSTVIRNAVQASRHWNNKLAVAGRDAVKFYEQQPHCKELVSQYK